MEREEHSQLSNTIQGYRNSLIRLLLIGFHLFPQMIKGWSTSSPPKNVWMHDELDPFTKDDEEALAAFCGQAAIALENARLYERMYTQPQFVEEMTKGVDLKTALQVACQRVRDICPCDEARLVMETEDRQGENWKMHGKIMWIWAGGIFTAFHGSFCVLLPCGFCFYLILYSLRDFRIAAFPYWCGSLLPISQ